MNKNEERNGEGKEFYESGELKFEGEYLNGNKGMVVILMNLK